jgi:DNA mismatch repair protein MutL
MSDIIKLLPESVANQIAAGEVIQRPASVVKELLENSLDAGATSISLIIKNSGKTLIQVIDNGKGMSETDARMSFERHATSKIKSADDLFALHTMGFRGEALASIASIAEVEMKTRQHDSDVASLLRIHSSEIKEQSYCQAEPGTSIAVKNLFFNVPARRKFLKTDSVELKYILEEFTRVALAYPEIRFVVVHNDNEVYNLLSGTLKKRVISLFRKTYEDKLLRVEEDTDIIKVEGLIGNPDIAKKQKGDQYIFVNKRFIKSHYLNHAIKGAYSHLVSEDQHPFFVLFLEIDPAKIDINVHPTKQEIKFDDERVIYNYVKVSVKHALGRYSMTPILDFENQDNNFKSIPDPRSNADRNDYVQPRASLTRSAPVMRNWQSLYNTDNVIDLDSDIDEEELTMPSAATGDLLGSHLIDEPTHSKPYQLHNQYIILQMKSGFAIIDQHNAHERILYERYIKKLETQEPLVQKQLFPITIQISKDKQAIFETLQDALKKFGFDIQSFGGNTYVANGIPAGMEESNLQSVIDLLIEQYTHSHNLDMSKNEKLAIAMAQSTSVRKGKILSSEEIEQLIDDLFACANPHVSPTGKKVFVTYELSELEKQFS